LVINGVRPDSHENGIWVHFWVQIETVGHNGFLPIHGGTTGLLRLLSATLAVHAAAPDGGDLG
jgi:hypothetical protein